MPPDSSGTPTESPSPYPEEPHVLRPPGLFLKWIFGAGTLLWVAATIAPMRADALGLSVRDLDLLRVLSDWPTPCVQALAFVFWLVVSWKTVPFTHRLKWDHGHDVIRLFFPIYAVFRVVAMQQKLPAALNISLADVDESPRAPAGLATLAPLFSLVAAYVVLRGGTQPRVVFLAVVSINAVWFLFMEQCDAARVALAEARDRAYRRQIA
jgi:hypothetical protein